MVNQDNRPGPVLVRMIDETLRQKSMLETCFGKESQLRKDLLIDSDKIDVDLSNIIAGVKAEKKKAAREARV